MVGLIVIHGEMFFYLFCFFYYVIVLIIRQPPPPTIDIFTACDSNSGKGRVRDRTRATILTTMLKKKGV